MQATLNLKIVNKETMNVLTRTLPNKANYFERVGVKIGLLIKESLLHNAYALVSLYQLHEEILNLNAYFDDEIDKFEGQIEKKKVFDCSKVNFIAQYHYDMPCQDALRLALYELMQGFDKLISTLKLLHLSATLESRSAFYQLKERYQKKLNSLLSEIIQVPSAKIRNITITELIENPETVAHNAINIQVLIKAVNAPYAPELSPQKVQQLNDRFNQLAQKSEAGCP